MRRNVLLVGASSPLGRAVAMELSARGHEVRRTSRAGGAGFEQLDITDNVQILQTLEREQLDTVVYLANPKLEHFTDVSPLVDSAVDAARNFATECAKHGVDRLVFASSAAVYGTTAKTPRSESDDTELNTPYAALKLRSEKALGEVGASYALSVFNLRIFNIYGPGFSKSLINRLALGDSPPAQVRSTEHFVRDYIHVTDVARAFGSAIDAMGVDSVNLNVGTGVGTSNRSLLGLCPNAVYDLLPGPEPHSFSVANISLIRDLWGFQPQVSLATALQFAEKYLR